MDASRSGGVGVGFREGDIALELLRAISPRGDSGGRVDCLNAHISKCLLWHDSESRLLKSLLTGWLFCYENRIKTD